MLKLAVANVASIAAEPVPPLPPVPAFPRQAGFLARRYVSDSNRWAADDLP
jgi:hypothetical protein